MSKKKYFRILLFLFILVVIILIIFILQNKQIFNNAEKQSDINVKDYIASKIKVCAKENRYTECLENAASDFLQKFSSYEVFNVFEKNETDPNFFQYCHTTLHFLGRELYKVKKNTKDSLSLCTSACFQGCNHGVLEGYLEEKGVSNDNDVALRDEIVKICGQGENYEKQELYNECLHGLGHALMFVTDGELPRSLYLCDSLDDQKKRDWCYSGSFMENSTSSTNIDHPSKYLKAEDPLYPCNILEEKYLDMCYTLQGLYYADLTEHDVKKTAELCQKVPQNYKIGCFRAIGQGQVGITQELSKIKNDCNLVGESEFVQACIQGAVGALSTRYSGNAKLLIEFCGLLEEENKKVCYEAMKSYLRGWVNNPEDLRSICLEIPEEQYKAMCLE